MPPLRAPLVLAGLARRERRLRAASRRAPPVPVRRPTPGRTATRCTNFWSPGGPRPKTTPAPPRRPCSAPSRSIPPRPNCGPNRPASFARQNRAADAVAAAERAVSLDADSEEGHRILGLVNAAWADGTVDGPTGGTPPQLAREGDRAPREIQTSPTMATDLGLQMTLARQLLASGEAEKAVPLLERVVAQAGPSVEPLAMLAEAHRSLGQFDRAAAMLEQAADRTPATTWPSAISTSDRTSGRRRPPPTRRASARPGQRPRASLAARRGAAEHP